MQIENPEDYNELCLDADGFHANAHALVVALSKDGEPFGHVALMYDELDLALEAALGRDPGSLDFENEESDSDEENDTDASSPESLSQPNLEAAAAVYYDLATKPAKKPTE